MVETRPDIFCLIYYSVCVCMWPGVGGYTRSSTNKVWFICFYFLNENHLYFILSGITVTFTLSCRNKKIWTDCIVCSLPSKIKAKQLKKVFAHWYFSYIRVISEIGESNHYLISFAAYPHNEKQSNCPLFFHRLIVQYYALLQRNNSTKKCWELGLRI